MKTRLIDIAKIANVSPSTVSLVLRGKKVTSQETREKILQIAREEGYAIRQTTELPIKNK